MDRLDRDLKLDIPHNMNLFAANFFDNSPSSESDTSAKSVHYQFMNGTGSRATITSLDDHMHQPLSSSSSALSSRSLVGNQYFQQIREALFGGSSTAAGHSIRVSNSEISSGGPSMDILRNHIVIDSSEFGSTATTNAANELQQQLEYDKFMNEIWIGIVLTLIIISMVFCICSCFLYHQFRQWKRNYRHNLQQTQDIESVKLNPDADDPVPEYTLVSGLPSYEAALELMQKTTTSTNGRNNINGSSNGSCLIVYPSALFGAFMVNEKESLLMSSSSKAQEQSSGITTTTVASATEATIPQSPSIVGGAVGALAPTTTLLTAPTTMSMATIPMTDNFKCQNVPRLTLQQYSIPSYEEAMGCQPQQQQQASDTSDTMSCCVLKSPAAQPPPQNWSEDDTTKVLLTKKKDEK